MEVTFDPQVFLRQRAGGISRLFTDLVREFDRDSSLDVKVALPFRLTNNVLAAGDLPGRDLISLPSWVPRGLLYAPNWLRGTRVPTGTDLVHHTYYSRRFMGAPKSVRQVVTVYDMIPEIFAGTAHFTTTHLAKRLYVEHCALTICISESTRQDMIAVYGDIAQATAVVPLAVQDEFRPGLEPLPGLPAEYLIYVGKRQGYKDYAVLPHALEYLRDAGISIPVALVGPPLTKEESLDLESRGLSEVVRRVDMDDRELRRAISNCTALVQTSRYEGFGLTPLEGMASGVPVVVARASSMPEVCGDVALYFEPGDPVDLASALEVAILDERRRADLSRMGLKRAAQFSTRLMAERTASLYRRTLDQ